MSNSINVRPLDANQVAVDLGNQTIYVRHDPWTGTTKLRPFGSNAEYLLGSGNLLQDALFGGTGQILTNQPLFPIRPR